MNHEIFMVHKKMILDDFGSNAGVKWQYSNMPVKK